MSRHRRFHTVILGLCAFALLVSAGASQAGFGDALKKKVDKATKKAEEAVDKATDKTDKATTPAESAEGEKGEKGAAAAGEGGAGGAGGKVSAVSTKFDFVPGDKVMFIDDFTQDELGEFPKSWKLVEGTFEVAEMNGERWLRSMSTVGRIRMKVPASLPEFWTLEFDFYRESGDNGNILHVSTMTDKGERVWEATYPYSGTNYAFECGKVFANTAAGAAASSRVHVMFMARGAALKAYLERERLVNVPDITEAGAPAEIEFHLWSEKKPMITNVRFAEGCKPAKDMLDTGKLVTYGIRFQTGSDVVLPESAPVLRQVAAYMESHADVKLKITGHTDNVGTAASNLDLSKRCAASVAKVLSDQFAIAADRFTTDGKGDTQAVASNAKPEGKAMNRRVEFAKL